MFLDDNARQGRLALASRFSISVIVEAEDEYLLLNPGVAPELRTICGGR